MKNRRLVEYKGGCTRLTNIVLLHSYLASPLQGTLNGYSPSRLIIKLSMATSSDSFEVKSNNSDIESAYEKMRSDKLLLNHKLLNLEKEIAEKCKNFGRQIVIEPIKAERRLTQQFFELGQPLTPIARKRLSRSKAFDILVLDGTTTCDVSKCADVSDSRLEFRPFSSICTSVGNIIRLDSISPEAITEEKPILQLNIERYSNSHSQKEVSSGNSHHQEISKLREEITKLQSQQQRDDITKTIKKPLKTESQSQSPTYPDPNHNFQSRKIQEYEEKVRRYQQKVYTYERIFTRLYNLTYQKPIEDLEPEVVNEIRSLKYSKAEDDLRAMFGKLNILMQDVDKFSRAKETLQGNLSRLEIKIKEGTYQLLEANQKLTTTRTQRCQFEIKDCDKGFTPNSAGVALGSQSHKKLKQIQASFEGRILGKYRQISQIKLEMEALLRQILGSQYKQSQTKKVQIVRETVEKELQTPIPNEFVKRIFTRKVKYSKTTQSFPSRVQEPTGMDRTITHLLKLNSASK